MADEPSRRSFRGTRLAFQKAEEAAYRRSLAAGWLESVAGPLGLPPKPSEHEFIACLRSGLVLCNAINKIHPGAVPKVVNNQPLGTQMWDNQPPPAYQYFENVRNFLVAVNGLKLPSFEASDLERDTLEAGSAAKVVDCILGLKSYHEWSQSSGVNGHLKHLKSPIALRFATGNRSQISTVASAPCPELDMSSGSEMQQPVQNDQPKCEDTTNLLVKMLTDYMSSSKENIDQNLMDSWHCGNLDPVKLFEYILSSCLQEQQLKSVLKHSLVEGNVTTDSIATHLHKCCELCLGKGSCRHWNLLETQESEIVELRALLQRTRMDFISLQCHLHNDFKELENQIQAISAAAIGYHHALKENRYLYNTLQELKGNIRVFCRIRPTFDLEAKSSIEFIGNDGSLMVLDPFKPQNTRKVFQFNKVFVPTTSQDEVYKDTQSLIRSVMDGYNVCIFAYGQTGSGKTHTMCGPPSGSDKDMGINYKALNDLFQISRTREDVKYEIQVQMVEIYNEQVRDLLTNDASTTRLEIRNSSNSGLILPDANMHLVQSTYDVLDLMKLGEKNRVSSSTTMNTRSSRSHSVLTVHVHGKDISGSMTRSCLHLVDLAGSERVDKSEVTGDRMKEAQHINKSLSCLGDVISALAQKNSHIPYRNSKLTQLLQNSLGGHAKMLMFAHVSPEAEFYGETISTLKFAQRVSTVELGAAIVNKESTDIRELKEQIDSLKKALASKEAEKSKHNMKENTAVFERSRPETERTPQHPRRLSIENTNTSKTGMVINTNDRKALKSPISRPKFTAENGASRVRRLSLEGAKCKPDLREVERSGPKVNVKSSEEVSHNESIYCPRVALVDDPDAKANFNNVISNQDLGQFSSSTCNSSYRGQLPKLESSQRVPNQLPETSSSRKFEEVVTSDEIVHSNKSQTISCNTNTNNKGHHIKKSLQTIGKLINGSDPRNYRSSSQTPSSKFVRGSDIDRKSPTSDARSRRRQSLTSIQPQVNVSRRASLGALSDSGVKSITRTTSSIQPPTKSKRLWL